MNPRIILAITRKDVVDAVRNYYLLFTMVLPLGMWLLFRVVFSSDMGTVKLDAVAVYDQGNSNLVEHIAAHASVQRVVETDSEEELMSVVRTEAVGGLILSQNFDAAVKAGEAPELPLVVNEKRTTAEQSEFRRVVGAQLQLLAERPPIARLVERDLDGMPKPTPSASSTDDKKPSTKLDTLDFDMQEYLLNVILLMALSMIGAFVVPTLLVEEKEKHTLKAVLVSPASYVDLVAGKALVGLFYTLLVAILLFALNDGLRGNVLLAAVATLLGSLLLVETGLLLGSMFRTTTQVNGWSTVILLLMMLPSWLTGPWPSSTLEMFMRAVPTYYMNGLVSIARNGDGNLSIWTGLGVLLAWTVAPFGANVWVLQHSER